MKHTYLLSLLLLTACASGPTEVLDIDDADDASCFRVATCVEQGEEAMNRGRFREATPYLMEACRRGAAEGCRLLAAGFAVGSIGDRDIETAESLYRWGCEEADDGPSCQGLGELIRLTAVEDRRDDNGAHYFQRACELGDPAGCHDEMVVELELGDPDEETEQRAVEVFERTCDDGLAVGCMNLAYMTAAGRGTGRDHSAATDLFARVCDSGADEWTAHRLAGLSHHDVDPDVYAAAEFSPDSACEQLELLVVGGYEERIIASFDAESDRLRDCYDDARTEYGQIGRITVRARVSADGDGVSPEIVDDELGLPEVQECVGQMLSRHLTDSSDAATEYETHWGISFVHPPELDDTDGVDWQLDNCDARAIQQQIGEIFPDLQQCGSRHMDRHRDDPGAVVALWAVKPSGRVGEVAMETTTREGELLSCLEETIRNVEIDAFDGNACPVQVPFLFSDGRRLHFSVVGE